jgi:hypothetical protein
MDCIENTVSIVMCIFVATGTCLLSTCLVIAGVFDMFTSRYQVTHVPSRDCFIATAIHSINSSVTATKFAGVVPENPEREKINLSGG